MISDQQLDQEHHRIVGHPEPEKPAQTPKDHLVIPYSKLPTEILRADGTCHVTMFTGGITTVLNAFIEQENSINRGTHLTEQEWLERFNKFVEAVFL
jgi:hypothetical protein